MSRSIEQVGLIGFGEAGGILGAALARAGYAVAMYDILLEQPARREGLLQKAQQARVRPCDSAGAVAQCSVLVISAVTASSSLEAAAAVAPALRPGQLFLDINSVSPDRKRASARLIEPSGADFVEAAVMAPVPPQGLGVPMLLGGARAAAWAEALRALGLNVSVIASDVGVASAVKMCRSILIKGLEALTIESLFAARRFGAEEQVLASLRQSFPHMGWETGLPDYLVSRVAEHGVRRAAEMGEVASTLETAGFEPVMARAAARRQTLLVEAMAARALAYRAQGFSWRELADALEGGARSPDAGRRPLPAVEA
ncbi:MAG TPA: DUF1932 domain-containing protein [Steroidobacteraceae bacterium]|nr:DUF1932 domain-containing protein [Steroidobacteraceae bacterium]